MNDYLNQLLFFLILSSLWPIGWSSVVKSHPNDCAVVGLNSVESFAVF